MKRIIKDPTYNIYSKGGSVETRKNRLTKEDPTIPRQKVRRGSHALELNEDCCNIVIRKTLTKK